MSYLEYQDAYNFLKCEDVNLCCECFFEIGKNSKRCQGCNLRYLRLKKEFLKNHTEERLIRETISYME